MKSFAELESPPDLDTQVRLRRKPQSRQLPDVEAKGRAVGPRCRRRRERELFTVQRLVLLLYPGSDLPDLHRDPAAQNEDRLEEIVGSRAQQNAEPSTDVVDRHEIATLDAAGEQREPALLVRLPAQVEDQKSPAPNLGIARCSDGVRQPHDCQLEMVSSRCRLTELLASELRDPVGVNGIRKGRLGDRGSISR